jgi:hypothetical protein
MRRRRLLAVALVTVAGCTGEYRASGPRTPPPAPPTDAADPTTADPVESRAQAVVRPLNRAYRLFRDPLATFEVDDVAEADLTAARSSVEAAREAVATFTDVVDDPPTVYRSLPAAVTMHERLVDALATAVDLVSSIRSAATGRVDGPVERLAPLRSAVASLATTADDVVDVADTDPSVPPALFLTLDRARTLATGVADQSTAIGRLLDAVEHELAAGVDWRAGLAAFDREAFVVARRRFGDALAHFRDAADRLASGLGAEGSFADLAERRSCVAAAGLEAAPTARRAADVAAAGDPERATGLLDTARSVRRRCSA